MFNLNHNHHIAKNLSNHIKNHPAKFNECIYTLIENFMQQLDLDVPENEITKLSVVYAFISMYSCVISDLNNVKQLMRNPETIAMIVKSLITDGNLKLRQDSLLVDVTMHFGRRHNVILASPSIIALACINFKPVLFYEAIRYVSDVLL